MLDAKSSLWQKKEACIAACGPKLMLGTLGMCEDSVLIMVNVASGNAVFSAGFSALPQCCSTEILMEILAAKRTLV